MGEADADRIGLKYKNNPRYIVGTANGNVPVYKASLDVVRVGDVQVYNVEAAVLAATDALHTSRQQLPDPLPDEARERSPDLGQAVKLSQVLYSQGFGARRECEGLIVSGFVRIAGEVHDDPFEDINPQGLQFSVRGESWPFREKALIVLNKPAGHECSQKPKHHPSVYSLLPPPLRRPRCAGGRPAR